MALTTFARRPALRSRLRLTPLEDRTVPAAITWLGATSGNFTVGAN